MPRIDLHRLARLLLLAAALLSAPAWADEQVEAIEVEEVAPAEAIEVEEVTPVEAVETVEAVTPTSAPAPAGPGALDTIGRLHPALVHLPIGFLVLLLLLDLLAFVAGRTALAPCGLAGLALAVASAVPAIATGLIREAALPQDAATHALIETHEQLMFAMLAVAATALALRWLKRNAFTGAVRWAYLGLMLAATVLVGLGGHWGGKLVFGETFLPF